MENSNKQGMNSPIMNKLRIVIVGRSCARMEGTKYRQQEEKLHQFLLGLDDSAYSMIISLIITIDPLPSVNNAYSICYSKREA